MDLKAHCHQGGAPKAHACLLLAISRAGATVLTWVAHAISAWHASENTDNTCRNAVGGGIARTRGELIDSCEPRAAKGANILPVELDTFARAHPCMTTVPITIGFGLPSAASVGDDCTIGFDIVP